MSHSENYEDSGPTSVFYQGVEEGKRQQSHLIRLEMLERVKDLRCCTKRDTCNEVANLIESYIPEWVEPDKSLLEHQRSRENEIYVEGRSDSGDVLFAIIQRLRSSLLDMEELLDIDIETENRMLNLILERYSDAIWEKRDSE
jgi:hypothetical protein